MTHGAVKARARKYSALNLCTAAFNDPRELEPTDIGAIVILGGRLGFLRARFSQPRRMFEIRIAFSTSNLSARDKRAIDSVLRSGVARLKNILLRGTFPLLFIRVYLRSQLFKQIIIFFGRKMRETLHRRFHYLQIQSRRAWWEVESFFEAKSQQSRSSRAKDILIVKTSRSSR